MHLIRERIRAAKINDAGLSLMEVIIAIVLIAIVASSVGVLTIRGVNAAETQNNKQTAITLANAALEAASARSASYTTVSGYTFPALLGGRTQAAVNTGWVGGAVGAAQTYKAWDTSGGTTSIVPITATQTLAGTVFTVNTMIGICYESTTSATTDCGLANGYAQASPPASTPVGYVALVRVIASVSWTSGPACTSTACSYSISTLLDPNSNLKWVVH